MHARGAPLYRTGNLSMRRSFFNLKTPADYWQAWTPAFAGVTFPVGTK